ncbi:Cytochrome P450 4C1, partial [Cyphomyrmex costatus]
IIYNFIICFLESYFVSAGTIMAINIYKVHTDPNFWTNPKIFDPHRFLPENIRNHHPYSYISFSARPRNCIGIIFSYSFIKSNCDIYQILGQRFAMLEMKAMIVSLIYNFYLEPIDYLKNLRLQANIVLCPIHPLRIRFIPICKTNANI